MRLRKLVHISAAAAMSMGVVGVTSLNIGPVHAASVTAPGCSATVGNSSTASLSRVGANCVLSFTSGSNSFTVPAGLTSVRALVVGGGGAGGHNGGGGGGGAEVRHNATYAVTAGATINLTVAAGGAAPSPTDWDAAGGSGDSSTFGTITASGGGGGGTRGANMNGLPGYTGGGGGGYPTVGGTGTSGANGGNGGDFGCDSTGGGGGGASGTSGTNGASRHGGNGGNGVSNDISGTATYYGGGGAGGGTCDNSGGQAWSGTPGLGGGAIASASATPNTGGGGGGGGAVGWSLYGGAGGSGIVILSWPGDALTSTSATLSSATSTTDGFTFNITNIGSLSAYTIAVTSTSGTVSRSSGAVTVNGLAGGASATVTVTTSRSGYNNATSTVSGSAIPAPTTTTSSTSTTVAVAAPTTTAAPIGQAAVATIAPTSSTSSTSVPETTTTTTIASRTRNAALPGATVAPEAPSANPGQASLLVDGQTVDGTITRSNDQLVVTAGELKATISGLSADGSIAPLDANGNIHLSEGDSLAMSAEGFNPGSEVEVWLFSTPTRLGTAKVSAMGKIDASFKLPSGLPKGQHRLVLSGLNTNKADSVFAVGIVFGKSSGVGTVGKVLIVTPLALAIIAALVLPARRRRKGSIA